MRESGLDFEGFTNKRSSLGEMIALDSNKKSFDPNRDDRLQMKIEDDIKKTKEEEEQGEDEANTGEFIKKKKDFEKEKKDANLNFMVHHGGSNLSNGEKQIINFLRSMLRESEIMCLDEATSNMDPQSGFFIWKNIY